MKRSEMAWKIAEELFYRDQALQHNFWYREEDRPLLKDDPNKDSYLVHANMLLFRLEEFGMIPPNHDYIGFDGIIRETNGKWEDEE